MAPYTSFGCRQFSLLNNISLTVTSIKIESEREREREREREKSLEVVFRVLGSHKRVDQDS